MSPLVNPVPDVSNASALTSGLLQDSILPGRLEALASTGASVSDWNSVLESGWYRGLANTTNAPTTAGYMGTVVVYSTTYATQTLIMAVSPNTVYTRQYLNGVWQAWVQQGANASMMREYTLFHLGLTATYTVTPLTAGTVEPANAPMSRVIVDASMATQIRIAVGQRVLGAGATSCYGRVQYATNQATQTTWADANTSGTGIDLQTGTANLLKAGSWLTLDAAAQVDPLYCRFVIITVGTLTTAPTIATAKVQFK